MKALMKRITAFIAKNLGISPILAAIIKYIVMSGVLIGAYYSWKAIVEKTVKTNVLIEELNDTVTQQQRNAGDASEDREAKLEHEASTVKRELDASQKLNRKQSARVKKLENENERLKEYVVNQPCLRKPWPVSLQRSGGSDLNQDNGSDTHKDRRSDPG